VGVTTGVEVGKAGYVYILASERNGTLYIGVTSELVKRAWQHREGLVDGFSKRNGVKRLVYFEVFEDMANAIAREKAMKKWRRKWKIEAIELGNPTWRDLFEEIAK
jgi:putative endonuclease